MPRHHRETSYRLLRPGLQRPHRSGCYRWQSDQEQADLKKGEYALRTNENFRSMQSFESAEARRSRV
jgi:hypothetical protein